MCGREERTIWASSWIERACAAAGKRLCALDEWLASACQWLPSNEAYLGFVAACVTHWRDLLGEAQTQKQLHIAQP